MKVFMLGTRIKDGLGYRAPRSWRDKIMMTCMFCREQFTVSENIRGKPKDSYFGFEIYVHCEHCDGVNAAVFPSATACIDCFSETTIDEDSAYYDGVFIRCGTCHQKQKAVV